MSVFFLAPDIAASVGAWLGTYLVHSTVLFLAAFLLTRISKSPAVREPLWRTAMFGPLVTASLQIGAGLAPVSGMWSLPQETAEIASAPGETRTVTLDEATLLMLMARRDAMPTAHRAEAVQVATIQDDPAQEGRPFWALFASGLLAVGIGGLTVRAALEAIRVHRLGGRQRLGAGPIVDAVERMRRAASITRKVRVETTEYGASPYATGVLFPRIVVPRIAFDHLDDASQRAMLAHELGHIARMDPLWTAAARSMTALFFFQPLNFLSAARLDETAEFACDEFAVGATGDEIALARCLTTVAEWIVGPSQAGKAVPACPMAHAKSKLGERVERILATDGEAQRAPFGSGAIGTIAILATAMAVPGVAIAANQAAVGVGVLPGADEGETPESDWPTRVANRAHDVLRAEASFDPREFNLPASGASDLASTFESLALLANLLQVELEQVELLSEDRVLSDSARARLASARARADSLRAKTLYIQSKIAGR